MKYRWSIAPSQPALVSFLCRQLDVSPLLAQCLLNRGLSEPEPISKFIEPRLKYLSDPFRLPNMEKAVERLYAARQTGEAIVIFGDYDVDGVTATALLTEVMTVLGWKVQFYLPHRMEEGYGLSQAGVENCLAKHPCKILLAVDCGSTSVASIDWLRDQGIDTIVLDHHQVSSPAPNAVALVNPQLGDSGGFTELCSAGLAFKLAHALVKHGRQMGLAEAMTFDIRPFLDLVALGTIADMVPLVRENRILVSAGLERLNSTQRPGICALKEVAQISNAITGWEVGFQLAPRLNAAGRLENALDSLHLLLSREMDAAKKLAKTLDTHNRERQEIEKRIVKEVIESVRARFDASRDFVIVEGQSPWHIGVVGIVASRVLQEFYRPTIILGGDGEHWRGSGRSIEGFDMAAALRECNDILVKHGGHAMAAGITIHPERVDAFRERFNEIARRSLKPEQFQPTLKLDAQVSTADLTADRILELEKLQQTGVGNPPVYLCVKGVNHFRPLQRLGSDKQHVKLWVTDGTGTREAVWWGAGDGPLPVGKFDLAFTPSLNHYNGATTVQLKVVDWKPAQ